jgi:hypothetical protein
LAPWPYFEIFGGFVMLKRITQSPYRCVATDYRTGQATALALDLPGCKSSTLYTMNHFGTRTSATPGSIRTTCGSTEEKYGTRAIAAAENSRLPPGRPERHFHAAYVLVVTVMPTYLTLE